MVQANNYKQGPSGSDPDNSGEQTSSCCSGLSSLLSPELFKAFADPKRVSLFVRLAEVRRPCTVGQIAEGSEVDLSVVSRHLAVLREAGVIKCVKHGKEVWCSVRREEIVKALRDLADALESCCLIDNARSDSTS